MVGWLAHWLDTRLHIVFKILLIENCEVDSQQYRNVEGFPHSEAIPELEGVGLVPILSCPLPWRKPILISHGAKSAIPDRIKRGVLADHAGRVVDGEERRTDIPGFLLGGEWMLLTFASQLSCKKRASTAVHA